MEKRALLIEWNPNTGKRAGNINPKDPNLLCHGWQNMDVTPAIELRLVTDGEIGQYNTTAPGVTLLRDKDEINTAIDANFPARTIIEDQLMYEEHVKEQIGNKKIKIDDLPDNRNERLKELKDKYHIKGLAVSESLKV